MPFDFLRRRKQPAGSADESPRVGGPAPSGPKPSGDGSAKPPGDGSPKPPGGGGPATAPISSAPGLKFDGLTEDWRLTGTMHVEGRLSDALNRRETISISDVQWAPIDGSATLAPVPGLKSVDPYDLIAVLAGPDTLPAFSDEEKAARRVRKEPYEVVLEAPPFRIVGTLHVFPGSNTAQLLEQTAEMFVPLTNAIAYVAGRRVADPDIQVVLVNRLYVRGIEETGR